MTFTNDFQNHTKEKFDLILLTDAGAQADFSQATSIATAMVKQFGMSEKVRLSNSILIFLMHMRMSSSGWS